MQETTVAMPQHHPISLDLTIEKLVYGGAGLARHPDYGVIFVPGVLPNETVRVQLTPTAPATERNGTKRSLTHATVMDVITPSAERVTPPCEVFGQCGGCQWQHMAPSAQANALHGIVVESLKRLGGCSNPPVASLIDQPNSTCVEGKTSSSYGYRSRAQWHVVPNDNNPSAPWGLGYQGHAAGDETLQAILPGHCPILTASLEKTRQALPQWVFETLANSTVEYALEALDTVVWVDAQENAQQQQCITLLVSLPEAVAPLVEALKALATTTTILTPESPFSSERVGLFVAYAADSQQLGTDDGPQSAQLEQDATPRRHRGRRFGQRQSRKLTDADIEGDTEVAPAAAVSEVIEPQWAYGLKRLTETLPSPTQDETALTLTRQSLGFFQANRPMAFTALQWLDAWLTKYLAENPPENPWLVILDLFSGSGFWGLGLAHHAQQVIAVEAVPVAMPAVNMPDHVISVTDRVEAFCSTLEDPLPTITLVDPPRVGCSAAVIRHITALTSDLIVYVSCNPTTLARDTQRIVATGDWALTVVQPFAFFPQTSHVESIAIFTRQANPAE